MGILIHTIGLMTIPYSMEMIGVWTPAHTISASQMRKDTFDLGQSTKVKPGVNDMVISDLWGPLFSTKTAEMEK